MYCYKLDSNGYIIREHEGIVPRPGWFPSKDKIDATKYRIVQGKLVEIPAPVPVDNQKLYKNHLNKVYLPAFKSNKDAYTSAQMLGNTSLMEEIAAEYQLLWQEYNTKMEAIDNGNEMPDLRIQIN